MHLRVYSPSLLWFAGHTGNAAAASQGSAPSVSTWAGAVSVHRSPAVPTTAFVDNLREMDEDQRRAQASGKHSLKDDKSEDASVQDAKLPWYAEISKSLLASFMHATRYLLLIKWCDVFQWLHISTQAWHIVD